MPKHVVQSQRSLENLQLGAATKHGLTSTLDPSLWAPEWAVPYRERLQELLSLSHVDASLDRGLLALIARTETMLGKAYAWVAKNGLVSKGGRLRPVVAHIAKLEKDLSAFYGQAGLSPSSRRQLALGRGPIGISELVSAATEDIEDAPSGGTDDNFNKDGGTDD
jgi:phage terminase small subunit